MNIKSLYNNIVNRRLKRLLLLKAEFSLFSRKQRQQEEFMRLCPDFSSIYDRLKEYDISRFTTPLWQDYNKKFKNIFLPEPPFDFLRNKIIMRTMFVDGCGKWLAEELSFLEKMSTFKTLQKLLEEDYVGRPAIRNSKYLTSHNSIHHLYHLVFFQNKTKVGIDECDSIVEWGGGYGNMAKIVKRINTRVTYIIIDMPLFSCIQWIYLSTVLGKDSVTIITDKTSDIISGKINILPLSFLGNQNIQADMFIATWSLSESSKFAQEYVGSLNFFDSKHLLLAFQKSSPTLPNADHLGYIAKRSGAGVEGIDFLPNNYYAFR